MWKINYKFVLNSVGFMLIVEALFMLFSAFVGEYYNEATTKGIYASSAITFCSGLLMIFIGRERHRRGGNITKREIFFTVTSVWVFLALFGTLPYLMSNSISSFSDAIFESMCGFTTTGNTTITNPDIFPHSLLFWRSFTQWIGGIGIIIFAISLIPMLGNSISGQFFDAEATGIAVEQVRPRVQLVARNMFIVYFCFTLIGFILLLLGPMDVFDAACHAFSSISTGGFSTKQAGIAYYNSPYTEYIITIIMFLGATNFMLLFGLFVKFSNSIFKDEEFRWYTSIVILFTLGIAISLLFTQKADGIEEGFRVALFQVVSTVTTTGYYTYDYQIWGQTYWFIFLGLMLFCGSQGSTSGGMKISRLVVLYKNTLLVFKRQVHPDALYRVKINGKVISDETSYRVLAFAFLYITLAAFSAFVLSLTGMTFEESIGVSFSSISSLGSGLGSFGPGGTYESITIFAKYYLCFLMLVGRLEIFTVLSLFVPHFWKR